MFHKKKSRVNQIKKNVTILYLVPFLLLCLFPQSLFASDFPVHHQCAITVQHSTVCDMWKKIKHPSLGAAWDVVILPHRGYWGFGSDIHVPENSYEAYSLAIKRGFYMTEADFAPARDGQVMSHDYVLQRVAVSDYPSFERVWNLSHDTLTGLHALDRLGEETSERLCWYSDIFSLSGQNGNLAIVADVKQRPDISQDKYALNWVRSVSEIIREAADTGTLYTLAFKTPYTSSYIKKHLDSDTVQLFDEVLWMPQVASNEFYKNATAGMGGEDIKSSVDFIDSWNQPEIRLSVIAFETNYKEASDSRLLPFKRRNVTYKNILEYIYRVSGYRGGVFSEEPNGERGNVNRLNQWSVKDAELDRRGDPLFEAVGQFFGTHIVVTTDRPDVWLQYSEIYKD